MCCGKKSTEVRKAPKKPRHEGPDENPELGCYFYIWEGVCYFEWATAPPEQPNLLFAHPNRRVAPGKFQAVELDDAQSVCYYSLLSFGCQSDESLFLDSLITFVKETAPYLPDFAMMEDANDTSLGFLIAFHQTGNDVIGDRVVKLMPGKRSVYIEGCDCVGITLASANMELKSPTTLADFLTIHREHEARLLRIDPAGNVPPLIYD